MILGAAALALIAPPVLPQSLRTHLQTHYGEGRDTRWAVSLTDLNGDRVAEALVLIEGDQWCGSGGCSFHILQRSGKAWRLVSRSTISRDPIRVLPTRTKGWSDISVVVGGGGILPWHPVRLRFDGKAYPLNPSAAPATPLRRVTGRTVIGKKWPIRVHPQK